MRTGNGRKCERGAEKEHLVVESGQHTDEKILNVRVAQQPPSGLGHRGRGGIVFGKFGVVVHEMGNLGNGCRH